ncbi:unnamed protein product, partial [Symbiodinium necroappetens]
DRLTAHGTWCSKTTAASIPTSSTSITTVSRSAHGGLTRTPAGASTWQWCAERRRALRATMRRTEARSCSGATWTPPRSAWTIRATCTATTLPSKRVVPESTRTASISTITAA